MEKFRQHWNLNPGLLECKKSKNIESLNAYLKFDPAGSSVKSTLIQTFSINGTISDLNRNPNGTEQQYQLLTHSFYKPKTFKALLNRPHVGSFLRSFESKMQRSEKKLFASWNRSDPVILGLFQFQFRFSSPSSSLFLLSSRTTSNSFWFMLLTILFTLLCVYFIIS